MRRVRLSKTFGVEAEALLEQGVAHFGISVIERKRSLVIKTIEQYLALYPKRPVDPILGIWSYPVTGTPFVLIYDFDDAELRIHLMIHERADRTLIDLTSVEW